MPRMRTIDQAIDWLKETDPDNALTKNALRNLIVSGQLPHVRIGKKYLVSLEILAQFLYGTASVQEETEGKIRRIQV